MTTKLVTAGIVGLPNLDRKTLGFDGLLLSVPADFPVLPGDELEVTFVDSPYSPRIVTNIKNLVTGSQTTPL